MKIATRQSKLALIQSELARKKILEHQVHCDLLPMETKGDKPTYPFFIGKGLFVKELQEKLLNHEADIAVHSLKDLPVVQSDPLELVFLLPRAAKEDVLVIAPKVLEESELNNISVEDRQKITFSDLKTFLYKSETFRTQKMGTSSLHRKILFQNYFELETTSIRGNVETRLNKVLNGEYSCTFLAKAGLDRLGLFSQNTQNMFVLDPNIFVPSAGQGIIAVEATQTSKEYNHIVEISSKITCVKTCLEAGFERLVLFLLESDCYTPVGVYFNNKILSIVTEKNSKFLSCKITISKKHIDDTSLLLKKHHNIYGSFFNALCQSEVAKKIRSKLIEYKFLP